MKKAVVAASVLVCLSSGSAWAVTAFSGSDSTTFISSVKVTLNPNGSRTYVMEGMATVGKNAFGFTGVGMYDPATRRASERLTQVGGNEILTLTTCPLDPWQVGATACSGPTVTVKGYGPDVTPYITKLLPPISVTLTGGAEQQFVAALQEAEAAAARQKARLKTSVGQKAMFLPTPTPFPTSMKNAHFHPGASAAVPTPTPAYPLYGAVYTGGNPPATMKVSTSASVMITVQNTSSQTWPAGGAFHLSYHWLRGGSQIVHDGNRTLFPAAVVPGASASLTAKVTAPPTPGATILEWDMVQEGVTWFSDKGVPMSAPKNVNVTP